MTVLWRWRWISASSWFHSLSCAGPFMSRPSNWICCTLGEKSKRVCCQFKFQAVHPVFVLHPRKQFQTEQEPPSPTRDSWGVFPLFNKVYLNNNCFASNRLGGFRTGLFTCTLCSYVLVSCFLAFICHLKTSVVHFHLYTLHRIMRNNTQLHHIPW